MANNNGFLGEDISINIVHTRQLTENRSYWFLKNLPEQAGLTLYGSPIIHSFPNKHVLTENGISGLQMMIESHCAFHDWPDGRATHKKPYAHITISSCKPINLENVLAFIQEIFETYAITWDRTLWRLPDDDDGE